MAERLKAGDRVIVDYTLSFMGGLLGTVHLPAVVQETRRTQVLVIFDPPTPFVGPTLVERAAVRKA